MARILAIALMVQLSGCVMNHQQLVFPGGKILLGMLAEEVKGVLGEPDRTELVDDTEWWVHATFGNAGAGKRTLIQWGWTAPRDPWVFVVFHDGRAIRIYTQESPERVTVTSFDAGRSLAIQGR